MKAAHNLATPIFCDGCNTPARGVGGGKKTLLRIKKSRTSFCSHRECMEEAYEYANRFGKQGQRYIL